MAAGDGFKQVPFGFDKNEVNTYISDLRKKMNAMEADMRANNEKTRAAEKLADEADGRIKAAQQEADKKVEEISAQLEEEKSTTSRQLVEIRSLKERLDAAEKEMPGKIAKAVQAQIDLMDKARAAGCEVRADMSEKELKAAVILKKFPKANLDGKDDNYIQARFDAACEAIAEDVENQSRHDAADLNPKDPTKKDPLAEAVQRYNARMDSAWSDSNPNKEA